MTSQLAFDLLLPGAYRLSSWQVDRHEVLTTSVVPTEEDGEPQRGGGGTWPVVGTDVYRHESDESALALDLWVAHVRVDSPSTFDRQTVAMAPHGVGDERTESELLDTASAVVLAMVDSLLLGSPTPLELHADDLNVVLDRLRAFDRDWAPVASDIEVVSETANVLVGGVAQPGFVVYAEPRAPIRGLDGPVRVTYRRADGTASFICEADWDIDFDIDGPAVGLTTPRWARVVPLEPTPHGVAGTLDAPPGVAASGLHVRVLVPSGR